MKYQSVAAALIGVAMTMPAMAADTPDHRPDELVIVDSEVDALPVGTVLRTGEQLSVPAGKSIRVVTERGVEGLIEGPKSNFAIEIKGHALEVRHMEAIKHAFFGTDLGEDSVGATRCTKLPSKDEAVAIQDAAAEGRSYKVDCKDKKILADLPKKNAVFVDVVSGGKWCVFDGAEVYLSRRQKQGKRSRGELAMTPDGPKARLVWTGLQNDLRWPSNVAIKHGQTYEVSRSELEDSIAPQFKDSVWNEDEAVALAPVTITMHRLELDVEDGGKVLTELAKAGCDRQFRKAVASLGRLASKR